MYKLSIFVALLYLLLLLLYYIYILSLYNFSIMIPSKFNGINILFMS